MKEGEFHLSIGKICRLCATTQDNGHVLFVVGSEEMDHLVRSICCLLDIEFRNDGELPNWLCSKCQTEAARIEDFVQLVKNGQVKLMELVTDWNVDIKVEEEFIEIGSFITQAPSIGDAENLHDIEMKAETVCTKYRKTDNKEHKADCIEQQTDELVPHSKRQRRRPQRLLEEIQMKAFSKSLCNAQPDNLENAIDSCTLITSHSIADLRTDDIQDLCENIEVESNKDSENVCSPKKYFICEYCKDVFPQQQALLQHIETHKNYIYKCHECLQTFSNKNCFSQHQTLTGHVGVGTNDDIGAQTKQIHSENELSRLDEVDATAISIVVGANGQITSVDQVGSNTKDKTHVTQDWSEGTHGSICFPKSDVIISYDGCGNKLSKSKMYACLECLKSFNNLHAVRCHHKMVHTEERIHRCSLCPAVFKRQIFQSKPSYYYHVAKHTGKKRFTCNFCPKSFHKKDEWNIHNRVHTGEKPFKCLICLKTFSTRCNLSNHKRVHTGERPYKCSDCESTFKHASHLKKHKEMHLSDTQRKLVVEQEADTSKVQSTYQTLAGHEGVDKDFSRLGAVAPIAAINIVVGVNGQLGSIKEMENSVEEKADVSQARSGETQGSVCPSASNVNVSYKDCFKKLSNSHEYACLACPKTFDNLYAVRRHHKRVHVEERTYECLLCPAAFKTKSKYDCHLATHTGKKIFTCNVCPRSFHTKNQWKIHNRIHTTEKPYQCLVCFKMFAKQCNLITHKRIHTGERPYKCPNCDSTFNHASHLKKHKEKHMRDAQSILRVEQETGVPEVQFTHQTLIGHIGIGIIEDVGAQKEEKVNSDKDISRLGAVEATVATDIVVDANDQITSIDQMTKCVDETDDVQGDINYSVCPSASNVKIAYKDCFKKLSNSDEYACVACLKTYNNHNAVKRHYKKMHVAKKFKCPLCPTTFKVKYQCDLHLGTHSE